MTPEHLCVAHQLITPLLVSVLLQQPFASAFDSLRSYLVVLLLGIDIRKPVEDLFLTCCCIRIDQDAPYILRDILRMLRLCVQLIQELKLA